MKPLFTSAGATAADAELMASGLPGICLMEVASRAVAEEVRRRCTEGRVLILCGPGQNGGDGFAAARWLQSWGYEVTLLVPQEPTTGDALVMARAASHIPRTDKMIPSDIIIDGLFGTGLSRDVVGIYSELVKQVNASRATILSIDLPSGLCADTGRARGHTVRSDVTVTIGGWKLGLLGPGADFCGEVVVADIGWRSSGQGSLIDATDLRWSHREPGDHKGRSGHLGIIAGSKQMAGAAILTSMGALRAGAGLVTLYTPEDALQRLQQLPVEVMWSPSGTTSLRRVTVPPNISAIAVGPGMGEMDTKARDEVQRLWMTDSRPMVFDASALDVICDVSTCPRVITPHPGEAARLLGCPVGDVLADRVGAAQELQRQTGATTVLKGRHSIIYAGNQPWIVHAGSTALATAGSGDVLTGIIGALLARGVNPTEAALQGALVHGLVGERLSARRSQGWMASDIATELPWVTGHPLVP